MKTKEEKKSMPTGYGGEEFTDEEAADLATSLVISRRRVQVTTRPETTTPDDPRLPKLAHSEDAERERAELARKEAAAESAVSALNADDGLSDF
jgi:hypothetical protein